MCGISGFCDFNKKSTQEILKSMTDILHHRGVDDSGYSFYNLQDYDIGLGHKRLSILDLSSHGHQPMVFEHLEIVYNGEVYNFQEIKDELKSYKYSFDSESDTEVILKAYHKWGIKAVDKFNGMFAISIYDKVKQKIIMIRDRAGVKPFYYYYKNNLFMFASELKSFHKNQQFQKQIDKNSLALFLQHGYILQPHTIFKDTYKLESGHYLELDLISKKLNKQKYWDVVEFYNKEKLDIDENEAINKVEELLTSSFKYRMVSDMPVGVFLSGGYDSSIVTAILQNQQKQKLNTFTIGFNEKGFDEAPYAKKVAQHLNTNHTQYYCTVADAIEIVPQLCEIYDEPFGDSSAIPTILVSKLAKEKVSVSLSADGGDEIFAGYTKYTHCINYFNKIDKIPLPIKIALRNSMRYINPKYIPILNKTYNYKTRYEKIQNMMQSNNIIESMRYISQHFTNTEISSLILEDTTKIKTDFDTKLNQNNDQINQMLAVDYKTYMNDDILTKIDRATMSVGLEGREPFLDHRIIEFVSQLPSQLKYKDGDKKYLLKQITHKYLPKELMQRPKMGFGVPIAQWFKAELKDYFLIYLDENRLKKEGLLNAKEVVRLRDEYLNGKNNNVQRLWFILMFEMWYEKWM